MNVSGQKTLVAVSFQQHFCVNTMIMGYRRGYIAHSAVHFLISTTLLT